MAGALQDYRRIWQVTTSTRSPQLFKTLAIGIGVLLLVLFTLNAIDLLGKPVGWQGVARTLLGCASGALLVQWSLVHIPGSCLLHGSASGFLTPGQRRRLMQMALGGWLLGCAGIALAFGQAFMFPVAALWMLFAVVDLGWQSWLWGIMPIWMPLLADRLSPATLAVLKSPAATLLESVLVLALGYWMMRKLYPLGSDRRIARTAAAGRTAPLHDSGEPAGVPPSLPAAAQRPYLLALRQACRRRDPGAMLAVGLGANAHWAVSLYWLFPVLAVGAGIMLVPEIRAGGAGQGGFLVFLGLWFLGASAGATNAVRKQIARLNGEQALLRLTPLLGDANRLNRRLALTVLKVGVQHLAASTAVGALLACLVGGMPMLLPFFALCCLGAQFALPLVLRDYARDEKLSVAWRLGLFVLAGVELLVTLALDRYAHVSGWPWLALASIGIGAIWGLRRWRRMLAAPPAFPSGRIDLH